MSGETVNLIRDLGIMAGVLLAMLGGLWAFRRNDREQRRLFNDESTQTIALLEKQIDILERQRNDLQNERDELREAAKRRDEEIIKREERLEQRVLELERDYRNLVLTVTTMGFCARAGMGCPDYDPGDRRTATHT